MKQNELVRANVLTIEQMEERQEAAGAPSVEGSLGGSMSQKEGYKIEAKLTVKYN